MGTATAYGDSLTASYGVLTGQGWVSLLATSTGKTITNVGVLNAQASDIYMPIYAHSWASDAFVTLMIGANSQRTYGLDANKFGFEKAAVAAEVYFLAQNTVNAATLPRTGAWASNTPYTAGVSSHAAAGSTLTGTFTGPTLTVGWVLAPSSSAGKFTVSVDGTVVTTLDCNAPFSMTTQLGAGWGPQLFRATGFSNTTHNVVFTKLDANYVYIDWVGQGTNNKPVYLSNLTRFNAVGYASVGGSDANVAAYNSAYSLLAAQAQSDSLNVTLLDMNAVVNPATDLLSDGVHATAAIQPAMRNVVLTAINGPPPEFTYEAITFYRRKQNGTPDGHFFAGPDTDHLTEIDPN